uniref:Candidate secreted effector n=1 Tax=Meloidogyne incognita TaxID=6306 RepID=A0A914LQK3_MELIC
MKLLHLLRIEHGLQGIAGRSWWRRHWPHCSYKCLCCFPVFLAFFSCSFAFFLFSRRASFFLFIPFLSRCILLVFCGRCSFWRWISFMSSSSLLLFILLLLAALRCKR